MECKSTFSLNLTFTFSAVKTMRCWSVDLKLQGYAFLKVLLIIINNLNLTHCHILCVDSLCLFLDFYFEVFPVLHW